MPPMAIRDIDLKESRMMHEQEFEAASKLVEPVHVGLVGLGTVGTGVYKILSRRPDIEVTRVAVRYLEKGRSVDVLDRNLLTTDPMTVARDPNVQILVEVMGGVDAAREVVMAALQNQKHVVTANKELIAKHGVELFTLARTNGVRLLFEGAVAGGIPIVMPLKLSLAGNRIDEIAGILNGTTNYILTKMSEDGMGYDEALRQAKDRGFAEADATSDVEGFDTAYKISILASIAYKKRIDVQHIYCKGITAITQLDITNAKELGYAIKLIGLARQAEAGQLDIRVHPMLIPLDHPLVGIKNEYNAVWIKGDAVGDVMFAGRGAGEMPTASAVVGDVLAISGDLQSGNDPIPAMQIELTGYANILAVTETRNKYYIRLNAADKPGVIGQIGTACGAVEVSLESVMQRNTNPDGTASIVLLTHEVYERQMRSALEKMMEQDHIRNVGCVLRVL